MSAYGYDRALDSATDVVARAADTAFAPAKPCQHGTVLASLCGLCGAAPSCPIASDEHFDAADELGGFMDRLRDIRDELDRAGAPGGEIAAINRAIARIRERHVSIRDHCYVIHRAQRQAR